jgi:Uma2 family endonuclease
MIQFAKRISSLEEIVMAMQTTTPWITGTATPPPLFSRHQFTVDEYEQMERAGILTENHRVELIGGEVIKKMTVGSRHIACVHGLTHRFVTKAGHLAIVSIQNPLLLPGSVPEPDLLLLKPRDDLYASSKCTPRDVLLLLEVSDSSLEFDRRVKLPIYAEAGVSEYWIVNLVEDCLEVHRQPQADRTYSQVQVLRRGDETTVAALPGVVFAVADILGPTP